MECFNLLVEEGTNSCVQNDDGDIPLMIACQKAPLDIVNRLLRISLGLFVDRPDGQGTGKGYIEVEDLEQHENAVCG